MYKSCIISGRELEEVDITIRVGGKYCAVNAIHMSTEGGKYLAN